MDSYILSTASGGRNQAWQSGGDDHGNSTADREDDEDASGKKKASRVMNALPVAHIVIRDSPMQHDVKSYACPILRLICKERAQLSIGGYIAF